MLGYAWHLLHNLLRFTRDKDTGPLSLLDPPSRELGPRLQMISAQH